jgi:hypothetical protein
MVRGWALFDRRAVELIALEVWMLAKAHGLSVRGVEVGTGTAARRFGRKSNGPDGRRHRQSSNTRKSHALPKPTSNPQNRNEEDT